MTSKNPYEVLGISPNASDDEVKRAYRDMTRKYHPDANVNNPLADLAEEKFKEVQEAYDEIMRQRAQGGYQSNGGYQGGGYSYNGGYGTEQNPQIQAVYNYLNARRYPEALNVLNGMNNRDAQWYYLSAVANANMGNNRRLLNQLEWSGQRYQNNPYGAGYGRNTDSCGTGNACCDLWIADTLCECMGGDLCPCM